MKKMLLLIALLAAFAPIFAFEYTYEGNTLRYTVIDAEKKYVSVGAGSGTITTDLIIPDIVTDDNGETYVVTMIEPYGGQSAPAFRGCSQIQSITLPNTLQFIGSRSFAGCKRISEIVIPNSVTIIDGLAFENCRDLKTIEFQNENYILESNLRKAVDDLAQITLIVPDGAINAYVQQLQNNQPKAIYEKSENIFSYAGLVYCVENSNEVSVYNGYMVDSDLMIADYITHKNGTQYPITEVQYRAFHNTGYASITLGDNIQTIGEQAFRAMDNMTGKSVEFPASLNYIGNLAFDACANQYVFSSNTPPELGNVVSSVFSNQNGEIQFVIPCGSNDNDEWTSAANWNQEFFTSHFIEDCFPMPVTIYHHGTPQTTYGVYEIADDVVGRITYKRIFTPGAWETLYLPFEVEKVTIEDDGEWELIPWDINSGGHYYIAEQAGVVDGELCFDFTNTLEAHTPYIIQFPNSGGYYNNRVVTFHGAATWNDLSTSFSPLSPTTQMQMGYNNTLQNQTISDEVYILRGTTDFMLQHSATTLYPFECYVMPQQTTGAALAPKMSIRLREPNGVATSVSSVNTANPINYLIDGNCLTVYTNGQAVQIYSINGILLHSVEVGEDMAHFLLEKGCYIIYSNGNSQKVIL